MPDSKFRQNLIDTAFRGLLAVGLYVAFPAFSDVSRLWERDAGVNTDWPTGFFEYPPVSALYFEPLTLLPSARWAVAVNGLVMVAAAVAVTWLLMRVARTSESTDADVRLWVASPALLLFLPINWDVLVVLIALLGVVALYQSRESLSGVWHGIGTAFKLFPGAVVLPVLPLIDGWRRRAVFLGAGFFALVLPYLVYAGIDPEGWRIHLEFASTRTDFDSTIWGTIDSLANVFGGGLGLDSVNTLSTAALILSLLAVTVWAAMRRPTFAEAASMALIALLLFSKVVKPQYVLWLLPFMVWIRAGKSKVRLVEVTAVVQFVVIYFALPEAIFSIEAAVRAVLLVMLALDITRKVSERTLTQLA